MQSYAQVLMQVSIKFTCMHTYRVTLQSMYTCTHVHRCQQMHRIICPWEWLRYVEGCAFFLAKVGEIMMLNPLEVFNVLDPLSARATAQLSSCCTQVTA